MSSYRSQARRLALQVLYAGDFQELGADNFEASLDAAAPRAPHQVRSFARQLVRGVLEKKDSLDNKLAGVSEHWRIDRIHPVERSILRIGLYEILHRTDIPVRVAIDEAVELAKKFGDEEAWRLVNGILDEVARREDKLRSPESVPDNE